MDTDNLTSALIDFCVQCPLSVWFFRKVEPYQPVSTARRIWSCACLALLLPLFFRVDRVMGVEIEELSTYGKFLYRAFVYILYLRLHKKFNWTTSTYLSLLLTSIYTACQAVFQVIIFSHNTLSFGPNPLYIPVFIISAYLLPMKNTYRITKERAITIGLVIVCLLQTKASLSPMNFMYNPTFAALSGYLVLLYGFLLLFLIFFERYAASSQELESRRMQELASDYLLRNLRTREAGEADLRALHHDMKNHLLAIQELAREGACGSIETYIQKLMAQSSGYEKRVRTGSELLDGLLGQKLREAEEAQITWSVALDFRPAAFVSDMDLCTIFGNAMDNALEACGKVEPPGERFLRLRSDVAAGCLFITLQNSYAGTVKFRGGVPVTTKQCANLHGFGVSNIRRAMEPYGGEVRMETEQQVFTLTLIFPLPPEDKTP